MARQSAAVHVAVDAAVHAAVDAAVHAAGHAAVAQTPWQYPAL